VHHVDRLKNI
jgi:adenosyl cobinamide kinase/adenosyl cobinamide phosphate guanylyltransferase